MIYITGDTHGEFGRIKNFCNQMKTTKEDILIILGDAGINYYGWSYDRMSKQKLAQYPIQLFCIHGNHEQRPETILSYEELLWHGGIVYYEKEFPNILFAKDGEVYDFNGKKVIAIGGAYSVDKMYRVAKGWRWWSDEQPSKEIKERVEQKLEELHWNIDVVLSHTAPLKYEPVEVFLPGINQSFVDKSTEEWLDSIEERLEYKKWYLGHYHTEKKIDNIEIMFKNISVF